MLYQVTERDPRSDHSLRLHLPILERLDDALVVFVIEP